MNVASEFGPLLRRWRRSAHLSQQRLAEQAEVSTRHVSFLETGRASPSREMVLVLANALDLPLRERNALLGAAGFAPIYRESALDGERMTHVRRALAFLLERQEPYGAIVVDRFWNVRDMNRGARRVMGCFLDDPSDPEVLGNAMHALFHPRGLRPHVLDWEEAAGATIDRLHRETLGPGGEQTRALIDELLAYPGVPAHFAQPRPTELPDPFLPVHLKKGDRELRLFTLVSTLGTPIDVTAQELRIESYFPADDASDAFLRRLAERD
ncbi:MAG TPA: helix-turn-helix transcriptional regulator [Sandaracinaceae bacterium LLY-WYZ-13_1]|nr:helix-turn-helix transcriptional regulator [Sandaracinaceae bacterium LLY-WYZ-13_1]